MPLSREERDELMERTPMVLSRQERDALSDKAREGDAEEEDVLIVLDALDASELECERLRGELKDYFYVHADRRRGRALLERVREGLTEWDERYLLAEIDAYLAAPGKPEGEG